MCADNLSNNLETDSMWMSSASSGAASSEMQRHLIVECCRARRFTEALANLPLYRCCLLLALVHDSNEFVNL